MNNNERFSGFSTIDVNIKMILALEECDYLYKEDNERKVIIDNCLRDYLASKVLELDASEDVSNLNSYQLMELLDKKVSEQDKKEALGHVVFYVLAVIGNFQSWTAEWVIDEKVTDPVLLFEDGLLYSIVTSKDIDYYKCFGILYEHFSKDIPRVINDDDAAVKLSLTMED